MQALTLNTTLSYRSDISMPEIAADQALIKLRLAGICSTDLELVKGYAGFSGILGHEFVGVVEAVGDEQYSHWLNRRVVGSINVGCGVCEICRLDGPEHCPTRKVLGIRGKDGVFADYFTLPVDNLFAVPDDISDESGVYTEPLAAAIRVVKQLESLPIKNLAVVGPGRLGLLIAKVLALAGYHVVVAGRSNNSLDLPRQWALNTALVQDLADDRFDCVVDASGQASGFAQALRLVRPRGSLVLKSTFSAIEPVDLTKVVVGELNIVGSRCGPFADALAALAQKAIPVEAMIDGRYTLKQGLAAFEHAGRPGVRKILLSP